MKLTALFLVVGLFIFGCGSSAHMDSELPVHPSNDVIYYSCKHKYSSELNFAYKGRITVTQKEMFGQKVFIFQYFMLDGTEKFLTKDEVANYRCDPVTRINNQ